MSVPAVCAHPKALLSLAKGCRLGGVVWRGVETHKRRFVRLAAFGSRGEHLQNVHDSCACNELISIHNRVCNEVPCPTPDGMWRLRQSIDRITRCMRHTEQVPYDHVYRHYSGRRFRRYERAHESLRRRSVERKDSYVQSFVKEEKINFAVKGNTDPRMISARHARYNIALASYLRPMEHQLYGMMGNKRNGLPPGRVIMKGLSLPDRAKAITEKFGRFAAPVVVSLDCSRFDAHVHESVLRLEHRAYTNLNKSAELHQLLSWQINNKCVTAHGIKYAVRGRRMSGDVNTALGNCLLMVTFVATAMRKFGIKDYDMADDGDDCLLFLEEHQWQEVKDQLSAEFLNYGQELKVENVARRLEDIIFCQSRIVLVDGEPRMVQDPGKVITGVLAGAKLRSAQCRKQVMGQRGPCLLALSSGVPVLQKLAVELIRRFAMPKHLDYSDGLYVKACLESVGIRQARERPVSWDTRVSFQRAWGMPPEEQVALEASFERMHCLKQECLRLPVEWLPIGSKLVLQTLDRPELVN